MKSLSREFCRWTDTLGAGEPNIDQETIETLFAPSKEYFHFTSSTVPTKMMIM